jgi:hypothetical protein
VVAFESGHHLGLVLQPAERGGVQDAVAVALERRAQRVLGFGESAPAGAFAARRRPAGEPAQLAVFVVSRRIQHGAATGAGGWTKARFARCAAAPAYQGRHTKGRHTKDRHT